MIKKILFMFLIGSLITASYAEPNEEETSPVKFRNGIGFAAGFVTGYGLSYRHFWDKLGLQVTFAPYVSGKNTTISTGIAAMKKLYAGRRSNLFCYTGIHYYYRRYINYTVQESSGNRYDTDMKPDLSSMISILSEKETVRENLNFGFGPGFEIRLTENIVFDIMAGYALYICNYEGPSLNFTGETALFFYF